MAPRGAASWWRSRRKTGYRSTSSGSARPWTISRRSRRRISRARSRESRPERCRHGCAPPAPPCPTRKPAPGRYTPRMTQQPATQKPKLNPMLKLALDIGPLVVFFAANARFGIFPATAIFMATIVAALAVSYALTRHIAIMPVVAAVIVLVFGSLTLVFHDETFIKVKPTIIYTLFGATLIGGYLLGKPLLAIVFDWMFI